jgi:dTDP-D-glucose 4,6-dehydratase
LPVDDPCRRRPDIRLAREILGWQPRIALQAGLRRTIDWFEASARPGLREDGAFHDIPGRVGAQQP